MTRASDELDRISEYERAVCYYTLPRLTYSITSSLIGIYFFVLIEAFILLGYGYFAESEDIMKVGLYGAPFMVLLGIVVFTGRSLLNQFRTRRLLAEAANAPKINPDDAEIAGIPSPFENNLLIQRPAEPESDSFECRDFMGVPLYYVKRERDVLTVVDAEGVEIMKVRIERYARSFSLSETTPGRVSVLLDDATGAILRRRFSFSEPTVQVVCRAPEPREYYIRNGSIFLNKKMVGRIYDLRKSTYLDIEKGCHHPGLLAAFLVM